MSVISKYADIAEGFTPAQRDVMT